MSFDPLKNIFPQNQINDLIISNLKEIKELQINSQSNHFGHGKIEKHDFWDSNNSPNVAILITTEPQVQSLSTLISLESLSNTLLKRLLWRQCLLSSLSKYCISKVGWYYDPDSESQEAKGLRFQAKKCSAFIGIAWKGIVRL